MKKLSLLIVIMCICFCFIGCSSTTSSQRSGSVYDKPVVKSVQQALNDAGFNCGSPSGIVNKSTSSAIRSYRKTNGLTDSEEIDTELLFALNVGSRIWKRECDNEGRLILLTSCGKDGTPMYNLDDGVAITKYEYDDSGNLCSDSYYSIDNEPMLSTAGVAMRKYEYDENGLRTSMSFFGVDGKPVLSYGGYAIYKYEYDTTGNQIGASLYGLNGEAVNGSDGFASLKNEFDQSGKLIQQSYYDVDGNPVLCSEGYAIIKWDSSGYPTEYDLDGNVVNR